MNARRAQSYEAAEPLPEADRLDGFPHPRETARLYGHAAAEAEIGTAFEGGRMHHAWLVAGARGIGKATLAYRIARFVLHRGVETDGAGDMFGGGGLDIPGDSTAARQVPVLSHPGLLVIRRRWDEQRKRFTATIPIDEVRRLRSFLSHSAAQGAWRVVIVDQADELNVNAANALLKSLEEPPRDCVFLLVSSQPGRLLATIHSRCRRLDLQPLGAADLEAAAGAAGQAGGVALPEGDDWRMLAALAHGSPRRALVLGQDDGISLYKDVLALLGGLPRLDRAGANRLADDLSARGSAARYDMFFDLVSDLIARLVRHGAGRPALHDAERELGERLIAAGGLARWAELWETLHREKADAEALNLDRRSLVLETLLRIEAVAGSGA